MKKYKKTTILFLITLFLSSFVNIHAQRQITGLVMNESDKSVIGASVLLYKDSLLTPPMLGFAMTRNNGTFSIDSKVQETCWLLIKHIGYKDKKYKVKGDENNVRVVMEEDNRTLNEVVVSAHYTGIKVSGDTIMFDTKHFKNDFENSVADLLEKLPGMGVGTDGSVTYGGKHVGVLLIDGKNISDAENNGLIVKNMSSDIVDGVEIIQNYKDGKNLELVNKDKETALNIKTKGKKNITGNIDINGGYQDKYHLKSFTLGLNDKLSFTSIISSNNIGVPVFTFSDYIQHMIANDGLSANGNMKLNISGNESRMLYRPDNIYKDNGRLASFNAKYKANDKFCVNTSILMNYNDVKSGSARTETYLSSDNITINSDLNNKEKGSLFVSKVKADWTPTDKVSLLSSVRVVVGNNDRNNNVTSATKQEVNHQQKGHDNDINLDYVLSSKIALGKSCLLASVKINHSRQKHIFGLYTYNWILPTAYHDVNDGLYLFDNMKRKHRTNISTDIGYDFNISKSYTLSTSLNYLFENKNFKTGSVYNVVEKSEAQEYKANIFLKKIKGDVQFSIGSSFVEGHYDYTSRFCRNRFNVLPNMEIEYSFNDMRKLSLRLSRNNEFTDIEKLTNTDVVESYNEMRTSSKVCTPYQTNNALSVNYFDYNIEKETYLTVYSFIQSSRNSVVSQINQEGIVNTKSYTDKGHTYSAYALADFDKRFKSIPFNVKAALAVNRMRSPYVMNSEDYTTKYTSIREKLKVVSKFRSVFNAELSLQHSYSVTKIRGTDVQNHLNDFDAQTKLMLATGRWHYQTTLDYMLDKSNMFDSSAFVLGLGIEYKAENVTLKLSVNNITRLRENKWNSNTITECYSVTEQYRRMPGYIILGVVWNY